MLKSNFINFVGFILVRNNIRTKNGKVLMAHDIAISHHCMVSNGAHECLSNEQVTLNRHLFFAQNLVLVGHLKSLIYR